MNQRILTSDKVIEVTTTVTETDRIVSYEDIYDSVKVEYDEWHNETPWEASDVWGHEYVRADRVDGDCEAYRGYGYSSGNREAFIITVDDDTLAQWGNYDYFRSKGCSKQVARELTAQVKRNALDQLVKWYENGWEWYHVGGEYAGYYGGCGGIDSYEWAEDMRYEIASEIATQMENDGYIIEDKPAPNEPTSVTNMKNQLKRNKEAFVINRR